MKALPLKLILTFAGLLFYSTGKAAEGQDLFKSVCESCHTIGGGKRIGPDLKNILEKRSSDWAISFIRSSQKMIKSGDPDAVAIFQEYNKIPMPDQALTDGQIKAVLDYITQTSKEISSGQGASNTAILLPDILSGTTHINIRAGELLFTGKVLLANQGASCIACHKVKDDRVFTSGTLAKDLTETFNIMGSAGIAAFLGNPPFPVMNAAFQKHPLTREEIINLTAYLKSVSENSIYQHPRDYSSRFVYAGIFFFLMILTSIQILYIKRKRLAVNHEIFRRQSQTIN